MATPAQAKCHIYSVWHYPKPQRCFTAYAPLPQRKRVSHETLLEQIEIPLPDLNWIECPQGDERMQGIAKIRALMDGR